MCTLRCIHRARAASGVAKPDTSGMVVFDRDLKRTQRDRAAAFGEASSFEYLHTEVATRVIDRLDDISRNFEGALDLGCGSGHMLAALADAGRRASGGSAPLGGGVRRLTQCDSSSGMLARARARASDLGLAVGEGGDGDAAVVDSMLVDEEALPFDAGQFDLVLSSMALHWVNDLPGTLIQASNALRPDGVFIGAMLGGQTLTELRSAFVVAEQERDGGVSPHVSPFAQVADCGNLLQRAGFNLPTVDTDIIRLNFPDAFMLMEHLGGMGEANACALRRGALSRDTLTAAAVAYHELYGNADGTVPATFQVIYMIGWKPHETQARPKRRGSATRSLKELSKPQPSRTG